MVEPVMEIVTAENADSELSLTLSAIEIGMLMSSLQGSLVSLDTLSSSIEVMRTWRTEAIEELAQEGPNEEITQQLTQTRAYLEGLNSLLIVVTERLEKHFSLLRSMAAECNGYVEPEETDVVG